jgi:hypothetical protein
MATITALKAPKLQKVWVLLGTALLLNSFADILFFSNPDTFLYSNVSNIIWFGTALLFFYALYMHKFLYRGG